MTCEERKDLIFLDVAGALEPDERDALHAHLASGCEACLAELAAAQGLVARADVAVAPAVAATLPPLAIGRLMDRIAPTPPATPSRPPRAPDATPFRPFRPFDLLRRIPVPLAGAFAATAIVVAGASVRPIIEDESLGWISRAGSAIPVVLTGSAAGGSGAVGNADWDPTRREWHVNVSRLPTPADGRRYQLWVVPAHGQARSQVLGLDAGGCGGIVVPNAGDLGPPATILISEESSGGGNPAPTSPPCLAGRVE